LGKSSWSPKRLLIQPPVGYLGFQDFSKAELLGYYAKMMDGGYSGDGKVLRYQARKLKVRSLPRLNVMADGIEQGKGTVTIKRVPGALRVIAAKKSPNFESPVKDERSRFQQRSR